MVIFHSSEDISVRMLDSICTKFIFTSFRIKLLEMNRSHQDEVNRPTRRSWQERIQGLVVCWRKEITCRRRSRRLLAQRGGGSLWIRRRPSRFRMMRSSWERGNWMKTSMVLKSQYQRSQSNNWEASSCGESLWTRVTSFESSSLKLSHANSENRSLGSLGFNGILMKYIASPSSADRCQLFKEFREKA